ncbi:MAG: hypothetical protein K2J39_06710 [Ruminococcus sp.]|nr:hypothetical protein [Ruminococcus sp.]
MSSEKDRKNGIENATKEEIYAALKLIECLYKNGEISKHIFTKIFDKYCEKHLDK